MEPSDVAAPTGQVLAAARHAEVPGGSTAAQWWSAFREQLKMQGPAGALHEGEFGIRAEFGSVWSHRELAPAIKSLLDGFIAALHVHDGSGRDHVTAALNAVGDGECLWNLLNESEIAILGRRRLVRPHESKLAWNPANERCGFFEVTRTTQHDALTVTIYALAQ